MRHKLKRRESAERNNRESGAVAAGPASCFSPRRVRPRSSVGGFAYGAGGAAQLSRNPVLGGAGHRWGNLVHAVGRGSGVGARAAGEGTWRGMERRRGGGYADRTGGAET